ncbi:maleylacetoacetate isomerase [Saccharospirillum impatiens]|uniref:maleylacetoacetate isomerase n=1 Tax=Saccharospirillum impatiens TaxID=169438 RepID=UPI0004142060|nr:maleylacetoacetate isomerase [Saccharospirillum impatiens]
MLTLHSYYRSSAAFRVRIALNLKGLDYQQIPVNLLKGEHRLEAHRQRNPQGLVPVLETEGGEALSQSMAICEYLEESYPLTPLLPDAPVARARVRSLAMLVACEMHPLNNLSVLGYLTDTIGVDEATKLAWYQHWVTKGFTAFETRLTQDTATGSFCHGDKPTLADVFLVPQVFNAERFNCDLSAYPTLVRIAARCRELPEFARAAPAAQPDAV